MKKFKKTFVAGLCVLGMSSCTIMHTAVVTNNPVGTKKYVMKSKPFAKDQGLSYNEAMKKGKITKLGVAEIKMKWAFIVIPTITITGE
jgi:hypothetical protein